MNKWIEQLPKIELHCHLDGSVRPQTIMELASSEGSDLSMDEIIELMRVPPSCSSLIEYLKRFDLPLSYMQTADSLTRIAREVAEDAANENVKYMEVRFAPQFHTQKSLTVDEVIDNVAKGLEMAESYADIKVRMIIICIRHHSSELNKKVIEAAHRFTDRGVVGVDLAGDEANYPPEQFVDIFELANELGMPITIHAGEAGGADNIRTAVEQLHARRIGHGVRLQESEQVKKFVLEHKIPLEMSVISNIHTKAVAQAADHPIAQFLKEGIAVTVNTDNRTVSNTNLTKEYNLLHEQFSFEPSDYITVAVQAINSSFADDELKLLLMQKFRDEWKQLGLIAD